MGLPADRCVLLQAQSRAKVAMGRATAASAECDERSAAAGVCREQLRDLEQQAADLEAHVFR